MYKLIIVEDEEYIRGGLVKHIPWEDYGFEVVGECENGMEALSLIHKCHPDVVMTDIRMPVMDGLELIETIRLKGITSKVVILTVYDDFEYARKSLYLGASAYLLKPTKELEIRSTFTKLKKELDDNKVNSRNDRKLQDEKLFFEGTIPEKREPALYASDKTKENMEMENCSELIDSVINLKTERIIPLVYQYMECLLETCPEVQFLYIKVDELVARLFFKLSNMKINIKDFFDDVTLYYKISGNQTFTELREWLKDFLFKVCGAIRNISMFTMDPIIRKVTDHIGSNLSCRITLEELADIAFMNPTYFSRFFKQKTGKTITEYTTDIRLDLAKNLLAESDSKIYEVAEKVGYDDFRHFSKMFRLREGMSPSEFKRKTAEPWVKI